MASDDDTRLLAEQVRELADRAEIGDLVSRLGLWLDEQRFDRPELLFTADATVDTAGGSGRGMEGLVEQARRNHSHYARTHHVTTNFLITLDRDRATARAN